MAIAADTHRADRLPRIQTPTLVLHGEADPLIPVAAGHDLARDWYRRPGRRETFLALLARVGQVTAFVSEVRCLANAEQKVDLAAMMGDLAERGVNELHIEAGHLLNGSLLRGGWVDELLIYLAPKMLGPGRGMAQLPALTELSQGLGFHWVECTPIGDDLRLRARV